jgi:hypothetical protein
MLRWQKLCIMLRSLDEARHSVGLPLYARSGSFVPVLLHGVACCCSMYLRVDSGHGSVMQLVKHIIV